MGVEWEIKEIDFQKLLEELRSGNVDLVMSGRSMKAIDKTIEKLMSQEADGFVGDFETYVQSALYTRI